MNLQGSEGFRPDFHFPSDFLPSWCTGALFGVQYEHKMPKKQGFCPAHPPRAEIRSPTDRCEKSQGLFATSDERRGLDFLRLSFCPGLCCLVRRSTSPRDEHILTPKDMFARSGFLKTKHYSSTLSSWICDDRSIMNKLVQPLVHNPGMPVLCFLIRQVYYVGIYVFTGLLIHNFVCCPIHLQVWHISHCLPLLTQ